MTRPDVFLRLLREDRDLGRLGLLFKSCSFLFWRAVAVLLDLDLLRLRLFDASVVAMNGREWGGGCLRRLDLIDFDRFWNDIDLVFLGLRLFNYICYMKAL